MNVEQIINQIVKIAVEYGPKLLGAIVVLLIGIWIIKIFTRTFDRMLDKRKTDKSLRPFLKS
jgi:small conductance mechanosensitive channel